MTGKCLQSTDAELSEMGDPTLKFGVDLSYGCTLSYTYDELKAMCDSENAFNPVAGLEIFSNLDNIDSFGRFGNAYIYYPQVSTAHSANFMQT